MTCSLINLGFSVRSLAPRCRGALDHSSIILVILLLLFPFSRNLCTKINDLLLVLLFTHSLLVFNIGYILLCLKDIFLFLIKIYQRVAPISLRDKCRFEPSCSNYMLQSIEKYGLCRGLKKGISRIKRCNINDGGYDYP